VGKRKVNFYMKQRDAEVQKLGLEPIKFPSDILEKLICAGETASYTVRFAQKDIDTD